jgi:DNA-binding PadR family transcriptional regulator
MTKTNFLGEFEIVVLAAILHLGDAAYGIAIIDEIETRIDRKVTIGALYTTLSRLEGKNYISGRTGEATPERGGRAKKFFNLTSEGQIQLQKSIEALNSMLANIPGWAVGAPA